MSIDADPDPNVEHQSPTCAWLVCGKLLLTDDNADGGTLLRSDWVRTFNDGLAQSTRSPVADTSKLHCLLAARMSEAGQRWGALGLQPEQFVECLSARCAEVEGDPLAALERLHGADLYLACACCHRSPQALAVLEREFLPQLPRALHRLSLSPPMVQEVVQEVRKQLFVANRSGERPALERYLGRAPLRAWLRAVALRTAMRLLRGRAHEVPVEDSFLEDRLSHGGDAELTFLRAAYRPAFRAAFSSALASLETRQRNLLRQHYLDGVSVEHLAVMYNVHRVTLSRWLAAARRALAGAVEDGLMSSLGLRHSECASVVRLCMSRPELTFGSFLAADGKPSADAG